MKDYIPRHMLGLNSFMNTEKIRACAIEGRNEVVQTHSRKAFYKISLLSGKGVIQYESHHFEVNGSTLLSIHIKLFASHKTGL